MSTIYVVTRTTEEDGTDHDVLSPACNTLEEAVALIEEDSLEMWRLMRDPNESDPQHFKGIEIGRTPLIYHYNDTFTYFVNQVEYDPPAIK